MIDRALDLNFLRMIYWNSLFSVYLIFQDHLDATEEVALNFEDDEEILNRKKKFRSRKYYYFLILKWLTLK